MSKFRLATPEVRMGWGRGLLSTSICLVQGTREISGKNVEMTFMNGTNTFRRVFNPCQPRLYLFYLQLPIRRLSGLILIHRLAHTSLLRIGPS